MNMVKISFLLFMSSRWKPDVQKKIVSEILYRRYTRTLY